MENNPKSQKNYAPNFASQVFIGNEKIDLKIVISENDKPSKNDAQHLTSTVIA